MSTFSPYIENIKILCEKHKVASLYLFGFATGIQFYENSSIDFLVTFDSINLYEYYSNYLSLKNNLKKLFDREIDLAEEQTFKDPM